MQKNKLKNSFANSGEWQGEPAVLFGAAGYEAVLLPRIGGILVSLKNNELGLDLLRSPHDMDTFKIRPQVFGIPVLFPPNRIEKGTFTRGGRTYHFPVNEPNNKGNHIHGLLRFKQWLVTRMETVNDEAYVEITFQAGPEVDFFSFYPHVFTFKLLYSLSGAGLKQKITIKNSGSEPMPLGLGFHTAFNVPFSSDGNADTCRLKVTVGEKWLLSESLMPTGELIPVTSEINRAGIKPQGEPFMEHYTASPALSADSKFNGAAIEDTSAGLRLVYEAGSSFRHWVVWNEDGKSGFVCPEPQTWAINAPNLDLPDEVTGFRMIAPDETWEDYCSIRIEQI